MNIENITPAQQKAIDNGGTNNAVIGGSLVKRGIMIRAEDLRPEPTPGMKFVLSDEYENVRDAQKSAENEARIDNLRTQYPAASPEYKEEIIAELARMGAVLHPQGTAEHEAYAKSLKEALKGFSKPVGSYHSPNVVTAIDVTKTTDAAQVAFAEAVDANDQDTMAEILNQTAPAVIEVEPYNPDLGTPEEYAAAVAPVRDVNTRYADMPKWTDDRLFEKEEELSRRLKRRTLQGGDRRLTENRLNRIRKEIEERAI